MKTEEQIRNKIRKLHTQMQLIVSRNATDESYYETHEVGKIRRDIKMLEWVIEVDKPKHQQDVFDEEMLGLAQWLKSEEGLKRIRESQEVVNKIEKIIDSWNQVDIEVLRKPFTI